jgi:hypothetical protein
MGLSLLLRLGMPIAMVVGAIAAWRMSKKENTPEAEKTQWRDDSLDDWRRERDAEAETERLSRASSPGGNPTGATEERSETRRNQRIGG